MLRGVAKSDLPPSVRCVYEIVIDGLTLEAVERATVAGLRAGSAFALVQMTAGNYGGKLGPFHIKLVEVWQRYSGLSESVDLASRL